MGPKKNKKSLYINIGGKTFLIKLETKGAQSFYNRLRQAFKGFIANNKDAVRIIKITDFLSLKCKVSPSWKFNPDLEPDIFKFTPLEKCSPRKKPGVLRSGSGFLTGFTQRGKNLEIFVSKKILRNGSLWHIFWDKLIMYLGDCILSYPDIILIHCAACAKNNKGYLFLGPSKSGKTTVAKLARARDYTVLSDDRVLVKQTAGEYRIYQLPLLSYESSRLQKNIPGAVIVDRIFLLRKDKVVRFKRVSKATCFAELLERQKDLNRVFDTDIKKAFDISYRMACSIPAFEMHFKRKGRFFIP